MAQQLPLFDSKREPPARAKGLRQKLHRFFFGDDIFISYSRSDAGRYATALATRLSEAGFLCFLDQLGTDANRNMPDSLRDKVRRSSALVLVGTRGAAGSRYVREEVEIFKDSRRPIFPIDVDGALAGDDWPELAGLSRIPESGKHVAAGEPAPETLAMLRNASRYRRRNQWLRLSLVAGFAFLTLVVLASGGVSSYLIINANAQAAMAETTAEMTGWIADERTRRAGEDADAAARREQGARAAQVRAEGAQEIAELNADEAFRQQKLAEAGTLRAREAETEARQRESEARDLEAEAKTRAAAATRQEQAARATLLAQVPGREFDALALAVEAAGPEVGPGRMPSEQIVNGLTASVLAVDHAAELRDLRGEVWGAQISPDARRIFVATFEASPDQRGAGTERWGIWDAQTGQRLSALLERPTVAVGPAWIRVFFSRDGARLAVTSLNWRSLLPEFEFWLCDISQQAAYKLDPGWKGLVDKVALDSDGGRLAFRWMPRPTAPATVFVADLDWGAADPLPAQANWKLLELPPPLKSVGELAFAPDGRLLLFGLDPERKRPLVCDVRKCVGAGDDAASDAIQRAGPVGITDKGEIILLSRREAPAGGPAESVIYLAGWQGEEGLTIKRTLRGFRGEVNAVAFAGGQAYAVTTHGDRVYVSGARSSESFAALRAHADLLSTVRYSPDGRFAVTVGARGVVNLWDARRNVLLYSWQLPGGNRLSELSAASFSADGERVAALTRSGGFGVWRTSDGEEVARPCPSTRPSGHSLALLNGPQGSAQIVTHHHQNKYGVWDAATCTSVGTLETDESLDGLKQSDFLDVIKPSAQDIKRFLGDGSRVMTVGKDLGIYLWDLQEAGGQSAAGAKPLAPRKVGSLPDGPYTPLKAAFEGGVTLLVANRNDSSFHVWREGDGQLRKLSGALEYKPPFYAAIAPDGAFAAAANDRGEVMVWDLKEGRKIFGFNCELPRNSEPNVWPAAPLAFSPDGRKLAVATRDGSALVYPVTPDGFLAAARGMLHNGDR